MILQNSELRAFADAVRQLVHNEWQESVPAHRIADDPGGYQRCLEFRRQLGELGWLSQCWPTEFGGAGKPFEFEFVLWQELAYWGAPINHVALGIVAPILFKYGTGPQQDWLLPLIASGEVEFALGYSEADAGTDLASLRTRADQTASGWIVNGTKLWTSFAHKGELAWLAARSDPSSEGRNGISLFVVDLDAPGIEINPIWTMDGGRTNEMVLNDVTLSSDRLVGELHNGWEYITSALARERLLAFPTARAWRVVDEIALLLGEAESPIREAKDRLGSVLASLHATHVLEEELCMSVSRGRSVSGAEAALFKVAVTELQQELGSVAMSVIGPVQATDNGEAWTASRFIEYFYRYSLMPTFGGGTNDVLRQMIARLLR